MSRPNDLLDWYDASRRQLPWRDTKDGYRIWVSEIMLQQTRVEVVLPYYDSFLGRFPTVDALAAADLDEVLGLWSGLGYYRRARQMHAAARQIAERGGGLPRSAVGLMELPGIGPYTAAAIASIAFDEPVPVVDGNVERVVCRLLAFEDDPRSAAGKRHMAAEAGALQDPDRPGDSNQALMELGATICTPRAPRCPACPLADGCRALAAGSMENLPRPRQRRPPRRRTRVGVVVADGSRVLLFKRPEESRRLAGIWEMPWAPAGASREVERALAERYGGSWRLGESRGEVRHSITSRLLLVEVREGAYRAVDGVAEGAEAGWFERAEIDVLAVSSLVRKILGRTEPAG